MVFTMDYQIPKYIVYNNKKFFKQEFFSIKKNTKKGAEVVNQPQLDINSVCPWHGSWGTRW
jgi:hypothetical protein